MELYLYPHTHLHGVMLNETHLQRYTTHRGCSREASIDTEDVRGFPQSLQTNSRILHLNRTDRVLPHPSQFTVHSYSSEYAQEEGQISKWVGDWRCSEPRQ
jgi:hypothetical protein